MRGALRSVFPWSALEIAIDPLTSLPRTGPWEVDLVRAPELDSGGAAVEVLFVVEHTTGLIRQLRPLSAVDELADLLSEAAATPPPPNAPGRPSSLLCRGEQAMRLIGAARVLGAPVQVRPDLPGVDEAAEALLTSMGGGQPSAAASWRAPLDAFFAERLWSVLPESSVFRFAEAEGLDTCCAVVLGKSDGRIGFAVYPTEDDYQAYAAFVSAGGEEPSFTGWYLHLDSEGEFGEHSWRRLEEAGLVHEDRGPRVFAMKGLRAEGLSPEQEALCVTALEAVLGAWKAMGEALASEPGVLAVETTSGPVRVSWTGGVLPTEAPLILDVPHRVALSSARIGGQERPLLVVKMGKRDAEILAIETRGLDAISVHALGRTATRVMAWAGDQDLGALVDVGASLERWRGWVDAGEGMLAISGGGANSETVSPEEFVALMPVRLRPGPTGG
ncbi:MAG: hypothetical protein KDA24_12430 [Deltaproteobacteria bacterium]|nr:hypothetical protein [Deltaproteobacteria bacterium]